NTWREPRNSRLRERRERHERRLLGLADELFVNTQDAFDKFHATLAGPGLPPVRVMRNAADYELADEIARATEPFDPGPGRHRGFFGTIFVKRRMRPLLAALADLPDAVLERLTLHCWIDALESKRFLDEDLAAVPERLHGRVLRHALLDYGDALRAMRAMDALVLVNSPDLQDQIFVPGKLYDYL